MFRSRKRRPLRRRLRRQKRLAPAGYGGGAQEQTIAERVEQQQQQYSWSPIRRVTTPPVERQVQRETVSVTTVRRPSMEALNNLGTEQQEIQKKVHEKRVRDLSDTLGGPYCESSVDCCYPGECSLTVGTITTVNMCSLPAGGLGKLASDPTCRRQSSAGPAGRLSNAFEPTTDAVGATPASNQISSFNKFALIPKQASTTGAATTTQGLAASSAGFDPSGGLSLQSPSSTAAAGPTLSLVHCDGGVMTLRVSDALAGTTVVVLGSIYAPKARQVDQLVLLSNSECPVIDVNIKMPKQHLSKQFLKTQVIKMQVIKSPSLLSPSQLPPFRLPPSLSSNFLTTKSSNEGTK